MKRIARTFQYLADEKRTALIPYITAGYPDKALTVPLLETIAASGGDIIEIGVPFSDPMADGRVIQKACHHALLNKTSMHDVLDAVACFRKKNDETPIVVMTYCNPIEAMGAGQFAQEAAAAGVDGVLTVDLPVEEGETMLQPLQAQGLDTIFLLSPTTTTQRAGKICAAAQGFIYYVALKGVTGAGHLNPDDVIRRVSAFRKQTNLPIVIGFGVHDAAAATRLAKSADGIVVGSALVDLLGREKNGQDCNAVGNMVRELRTALDTARKVA